MPSGLLASPESYWVVPGALLQPVGRHDPARLVGQVVPAELISARALSYPVRGGARSPFGHL